MGMMDQELEQTHAKEERRLRFEEFVKAQKAAGSPGMPSACLMNTGYRDSYGPVRFEKGMHNGLLILSANDYPKALLYTKRADAETYAKELKKILRGGGYPGSQVWADQVAVRTTKPHPYSRMKRPTQTYAEGEHYLIRMSIR